MAAAFLAGFAMLSAGVAEAPGPSAQLDVVEVGFRTLPAPRNSQDLWYEIDIVVDVRAGANTPGRMLSRVRCAVSIAADTHLAAGNRRSWHRCEAEAVALANGRHHFRFYLPPEILKRDSLRGAPRDWLVDFSIGERKLETGERNRSRSLRESSAAGEFRKRVSSEAVANDGIMRPQFLTPFENAYPSNTPTFIRRT